MEPSSLCEQQFRSSVGTIQMMVHANSKSKGFWPISQSHEWERILLSNKVALVHSEMSEALEEMRKPSEDFPMSEKIPQFNTVEEELADTIIRVMDLAEHLHCDLAGAILAKIKMNATRPAKHGKMF
jgi:NTP pyrophosphatase (non-canonical NTP hydrolase)